MDKNKNVISQSCFGFELTFIFNHFSKEVYILAEIFFNYIEITSPHLFQEFTNHKILGQMAGLRITKNKWVKYDTK